MKRILHFLLVCSCAAEMRTIPAGRGGSENVLDPMSPAWKSAPAVTLALQRTPPLYSTDPPAALEIPSVSVQLLRGPAAAFVRLGWSDKSKNATTLPAAKQTWVGEQPVVQSEATDRFSDAVALMTPARPVPDDVFPSLQMGDAGHPVRIFFFDATRGPALLEATGRGTTRRTGKTFPAQAQYTAGKWTVTMQLPELAAGTPLSFAVWNGDQKDRDGRKYFSVWYRTE